MGISGKWTVSLNGPKGYPSQTLTTDGKSLIWSDLRFPAYLKRAIFDTEESAKTAFDSIGVPRPAYEGREVFLKFP